jgi:hypothetical protein
MSYIDPNSKSSEIQPTSMVYVSINPMSGGKHMKYESTIVMKLGGIDNATNLSEMVDEYISVCEIQNGFYEDYHRNSLSELHKAYVANSTSRAIALEKMRVFLKEQIRREQLRKIL